MTERSVGGKHSVKAGVSRVDAVTGKEREMYSLTDGGFSGSAQFGTFQARLSSK